MPPLDAGDNVMIQTGKEWVHGTIVKPHDHQMSKLVNNRDTGNVVRRNRRHLKHTKAGYVRQYEPQFDSDEQEVQNRKQDVEPQVVPEPEVEPPPPVQSPVRTSSE